MPNPPRAFLLLSTESLGSEGIPQASGCSELRSCWSYSSNMSIVLDLDFPVAEWIYGTNTVFPSSNACKTMSRVETSLSGIDRKIAIDLASRYAFISTTWFVIIFATTHQWLLQIMIHF